MAVLSLLTFSLLLTLKFSFTTSKQTDSTGPTVYDILPKYGLPKGLLPNTVTNYTLSTDGTFTVTLPSPCYVQFEYSVFYETRIMGRLSYGSITGLKGIQVKRFFLWFDVDQIKVDLPPSDSIYFQVGIINKKLDVDQFKTIHSCDSGSCAVGSLRASLLRKAELEDDMQMLVTE